jgi:hypothetical protein
MVPPEWAFEVVSAAQRFICETADMNLATAPTAARRLGASVSAPANLAARVLLRSMLIEISTRWGDACHMAMRARCLTPQCVPAALAGLGRCWSGSWQEPQHQTPSETATFIAWVDAFCAEVTRTHPERPAARLNV